ncbi:MAG: deoxyribose-phosphate aldolase [candidate division Zixibacteria bacterium]|nr:deoxyribose-phosphate aldolase [candidate division Zixibacteria bacterium]
MTLNSLIDHALLKSEATESEIRRACHEAIKHELFGMAVNPAWIEIVAEELAETRVQVIGVAGFPLGATSSAAKISEALGQVRAGAHEIDMVAQIGRLAAGEYTLAESEINEMRRELPAEITLKVIIEAPLLTQEQQISATRAVINAGAQFVKSATGFFGGSSEGIVRTLSQAASGRIKVKISGGVRTLAQAERFVELGADRLGCSASVAILQERRERADVQKI